MIRDASLSFFLSFACLDSRLCCFLGFLLRFFFFVSLLVYVFRNPFSLYSFSTPSWSLHSRFNDALFLLPFSSASNVRFVSERISLLNNKERQILNGSENLLRSKTRRFFHPNPKRRARSFTSSHLASAFPLLPLLPSNTHPPLRPKCPPLLLPPQRTPLLLLLLPLPSLPPC